MTAGPKTYNGGVEAILTFFSRNKTDNGSYSEVNRLIMECATSKESLSTLYRMFKKSVFAVSFGITCDYQLAEDCVIETFIRLTQVTNFNPKRGNGKGYIIKTAQNVAHELLRRHQREYRNFFIQSYGEADKTVEDSIFINQLLKHLTSKQRQLVIMRCCSDLTFKEISEIMHIPETTARSRYQKAMAILQEKAGVDSEK